MTRIEYKRLEFDSFPYAINKIITIPENTVIFRGYHTSSNPLSQLPTYYSCLDVAKSYSIKPEHKLGCFVTNGNLCLLDLRYIIMLLREAFNYPTENYDIDIMKKIILSLGLCSLETQVKLLNEYLHNQVFNDNKTVEEIKYFLNEKYNKIDINKLIGFVNPVEIQGCRLGLLDLDRFMISFIKQIFQSHSHIDGFIAPKSYTMFLSNNYINEEILLFNPRLSNIKQMGYLDETRLKQLPILNIMEIININSHIKFTISTREFVGGSLNTSEIKHNPKYLYQGNINDYFDNYHRQTDAEKDEMNNWIKRCQKCIQSGNKQNNNKSEFIIEQFPKPYVSKQNPISNEIINDYYDNHYLKTNLEKEEMKRCRKMADQYTKLIVFE